MAIDAFTVDTDGVSGDYSTLRSCIAGLADPISQDITITCQASTGVADNDGGLGTKILLPGTGTNKLTIVANDNYVFNLHSFNYLQVYGKTGNYDIHLNGKFVGTGGYGSYFISLYHLTGTASISGSFDLGAVGGSNYTSAALYAFSVGFGSDVHVHDVLVSGSNRPATAGVIRLQADTALVTNCTTINCPDPFSSLHPVKNCIFHGADPGLLLAAGSEYNSSDSDYDLLTPVNNRANQTFTFVDFGGGDYRLAEADLGARTRGVGPDLDSDITLFDLDGLARYGDVANAGAYETAVPNRAVTGVLITGAVNVDEESTIQLAVTVYPPEAGNTDVVWESLNPEYATVDQTGLVTGVLGGVATIQVTTDDGGFQDTHDVTVDIIYHAVTDVTISGPTVAITGVPTQLIGTVSPFNATDLSVIWESLNPLIMSIDQTGVATVLDSGIATIKATATDGGLFDTYNVECFADYGNQEIIWASEALPAVIVDPGETKYKAGFVTEKWPLEWANFLFNNLDEMINELEQYGVYLWDTTTVYLTQAIVLHNEQIWKCKNPTESVGVEPGSINGWNDWTADDGSEIGDILQFSGVWVDDETMPGWYACVDGNQDKGCPNMVDRYALGKGIAGPGLITGSDQNTMPEVAVPAHVHTVLSLSDVDKGIHSHTFSRINRGLMLTPGVANPQSVPLSGWSAIAGYGFTSSYSPYVYVQLLQDEVVTTDTGEHTHQISGSLGFGDIQTPFDFTPDYVELIYIRKCR